MAALARRTIALPDGRTIRMATVEQLQAFGKRLLVPGGCALAVVGDFSLDEVEKDIRRNCSELPQGVVNAAVIPLAFLEGSGLSYRLAGDFAKRLERINLDDFNRAIRSWLAPERWFSLRIGPPAG